MPALDDFLESESERKGTVNDKVSNAAACMVSSARSSQLRVEFLPVGVWAVLQSDPAIGPYLSQPSCPGGDGCGLRHGPPKDAGTVSRIRVPQTTMPFANLQAAWLTFNLNEFM